MPQLNYDSERPPSPHGYDLIMIGLVVTPFAAIAMPLVSLVRWLGEPFGDFRILDIAIFGGTPVMVFGLAVVWCMLARKGGFPWFVILPVLSLFLLLGYWSVKLFLPYFREPWNW